MCVIYECDQIYRQYYMRLYNTQHTIVSEQLTRTHTQTHKHTPEVLLEIWDSMLLCRVATAMIFLLCMQSLVTAESALTSSAVRCVTAAPGSKLNTWEEAGGRER